MASLTESMDAHIRELLHEVGAEWLTHGEFWAAPDGSLSACSGIIVDSDGVSGAFISMPPKTYSSVRVAYYIALHEVGHLHQHRTDRGWRRTPWPTNTLDREEHAWRYALSVARYKPTKSVWRHIASSVTSYLDAADADARYKDSGRLVYLLTEARRKETA